MLFTYNNTGRVKAGILGGALTVLDGRCQMKRQNLKELLRLFDAVSTPVYSNGRADNGLLIGHATVSDHDRIHSIEPGDIVLIGFPQDEGVSRNLGRPGASKAPTAIREHLAKFTVPGLQNDVDHKTVRLKDLGDLQCKGQMEIAQDRLGQTVATVLESKAIPIIIGGGHETAYGHFLGYVGAKMPVSVINIDAHLDVRPLRNGVGHSGSPFLQILEHRSKSLIPGGYLCLGIQEQSNPASAMAYLDSQGGHWISWEKIDEEKALESLDNFVLSAVQSAGKIMLTIDMDSIKQSDAPGVSAPSPIGLTSEQVLRLVRKIAAQGASSFDIVECNPMYDRDGQTAKLAALIIHTIIDVLVGRHTPS